MGNKFVPIGIIIIAVVAMVSIKPLVVEVRATNAKIQAYQQQSTLAQEKIDKLNELRPKMASYKTEIASLKMAMPAAQQIPEVLVMTEAIAKNTGLNISGLDIQPGSGGDEVAVNMSATGSYSNLAQFTNQFEKNLRPIRVKSISVSSSGTDGQQISVSISLGVIYQGKIDQQVATSSN